MSMQYTRWLDTERQGAAVQMIRSMGNSSQRSQIGKGKPTPPFVRIKEHYFAWVTKSLPIISEDDDDLMSRFFDDDGNTYKLFSAATALGESQDAEFPKMPLVPSIIGHLVETESLTPWQLFEKLEIMGGSCAEEVKRYR